MIVQLLTESGWEDMGKTHIDLHLIANDLQPIPMSAELENCIVKGAVLDFVITPELMGCAGDDVTVESMSEISDVSESPRVMNRRMSFKKRLSRSMGLTSAVNISSPILSAPGPVASLNDTADDIDAAPVDTDHAHAGDIDKIAFASSENHSSTTTSLASDRQFGYSKADSPTSGHTGSNFGSMIGRPSRTMFVTSDTEDEEAPTSPHTVLQLQLEMDALRESLEESCAENKQLREDSITLMSKLERKKKKCVALQEKSEALEASLRRKDLEIKAVLNFQKKLESRMSAFVEKEKELALKEKSYHDRELLIPESTRSVNDEEKMDAREHAHSVDQQKQQHAIEIIALRTEMEALTAEKERLEDVIRRGEGAKQSTVECGEGGLNEEASRLNIGTFVDKTTRIQRKTGNDNHCTPDRIPQKSLAFLWQDFSILLRDRIISMSGTEVIVVLALIVLTVAYVRNN